MHEINNYLIYHERKENAMIHTLKNGAKLLWTSPGHGVKFSDGTECGPSTVCHQVEVKRDFRLVKNLAGLQITESTQIIPPDGLAILEEWQQIDVDIIIVPFMVIAALKEMGIRDRFHKVVAFNATKETSRSAPQDKIVDINNWSW